MMAYHALRKREAGLSRVHTVLVVPDREVRAGGRSRIQSPGEATRVCGDDGKHAALSREEDAGAREEHELWGTIESAQNRRRG